MGIKCGSVDAGPAAELRYGDLPDIFFLKDLDHAFLQQTFRYSNSLVDFFGHGLIILLIQDKNDTILGILSDLQQSEKYCLLLIQHLLDIILTGIIPKIYKMFPFS